MEAIEYFKTHWLRKKIWTHLTAEKHQLRLQTCANLVKGRTYLDVGCACGHSTMIMKGFNPGEWSGHDFHEDIAIEAKKFFPKMDFHYSNGYDILKEIDLKFDSVVCSEVMEHVKEHQKLIDGLMAITKKRLILTTPSVHVNDPGHLRIYDQEMIVKLFANHNVKLTIRNKARFWYIIADRKDEK